MEPIIREISEIDVDHPEGRGYLKTVGGTYINLIQPDPSTILLSDIVRGLINVCRYGGQSPTFYSVAEHSLHVAAQLHRTYGDHDLSLVGLLHDATEAYLNDVVGPLKQTLPNYQIIETRMTRAIEIRFRLQPLSFEDPRVKDVDKAIVPWEMAMIRDCGFREPSEPSVVGHAFYQAFYEYGGNEL